MKTLCLHKKYLFQNVDEEVKEMTNREHVIAVKTEPTEHSEASTPSSPVTPREDSDLKPVLSTANSTTDQDPLPDDSCDVAVSGPEALCTSTTDSTQFDKDLNSSLTECLVDINVSVGSGRNTPSPCPSTAGMCPREK